MERTSLIIGGVGILAGAMVAAVGLWTLDRQAALPADTAAAKLEERLPAAGRPAVRHQLPAFKWFGDRDESRLPSRPLGSVTEVIETEEGVVVVLDAGSNLIVSHDPDNATTVLAQNADLPPITPRQVFETGEEIVLMSYDEAGPAAVD